MRSSLGLIFILLVPELVLAQALPAPNAQTTECRVLLESMGQVGYRISDAQALAGAVMNGLNKALGYGAVVYEGTIIDREKLQKMLGKSGSAADEDAHFAKLKACAQKTKFVVRARFGKKKDHHWVRLSCRNKGASPKKTLAQVTFREKSFAAVREKVKEAMPNFCKIIYPPSERIQSTKPRSQKKWAPPSRR